LLYSELQGGATSVAPKFETFALNRLISQPARNALTSLLSRALLREGVYFAARTLFDRWQRPADSLLANAFTDAFSTVLDRDELSTWRHLRDIVEANPAVTASAATPVIMRIAAQIPEMTGFADRFARVGATSREQLAGDLIAESDRLIGAERFDAGLAVLAGAAHRDLAGRSAFERVRRIVAGVTPRIARVHEPGIARQLSTMLDDFSATLAHNKHHAAAVHTRLLSPLICGDVERFSRLGRSLLDVPGERLFDKADEALAICIGLHDKGYRTQAIELLGAATGATELDAARWQSMYEALPEQVLLRTTIQDRVLYALSPPALAAPSEPADVLINPTVRAPRAPLPPSQPRRGIGAGVGRSTTISPQSKPAEPAAPSPERRLGAGVGGSTTVSPPSKPAEPVATSPPPPAAATEFSPRASITSGSSADETDATEPWPQRQLNAWIEEPQKAPDDEFDLCADIGPPREGAVGGDFVEPTEEQWEGRDEITVRLVASGLDAEVKPGWRDLKLRRSGKTDIARFRVKTPVVGTLSISLRVYLADKMLLIDEHRLEIVISRRDAA
jgi:hypothetical protein